MGKELHVLSITRSPARFFLNLVGLSARLSPFLSPSVWVVVLQGFGNLAGQGPKKDAAAIANAKSIYNDQITINNGGLLLHKLLIDGQ